MTPMMVTTSSLRRTGVAENGGVGVEVGAPDGVAEDDDVLVAGLLLCGGEGAAEGGSDAEQGEQIGAGGDAADLLLCLTGVEGDHVEVVVGEIADGVGAVAPSEDVLDARGAGGVVGGEALEVDKASRALEGEWREEGGAQNGEHGGVRADAEGEDEGDAEGEAGGSSELAEGVAKVSCEGGERRVHGVGSWLRLLGAEGGSGVDGRGSAGGDEGGGEGRCPRW